MKILYGLFGIETETQKPEIERVVLENGLSLPSYVLKDSELGVIPVLSERQIQEKHIPKQQEIEELMERNRNRLTDPKYLVPVKKILS